MPDASKEKSLNATVGVTFGAAGRRCMATSVTVLNGTLSGGVNTTISLK